MLHRKSFLSRLSLMFVLLICLPITTITAFTAIHLRRITAQDIQSSNESTLSATLSHLEFQFEQYARITDSIVLSTELCSLAQQPAAPSSYEQLLNDRTFSQTVSAFLIRNYEVNAVYLFTTDGYTYQTGNTYNYESFIAPQAYALLSQRSYRKNDAILYSGCFVAAHGGPETYIPVIYRPFYHPYNRKLLGMVAIEIIPQIYQQTLRDLHDHAFVLSPDGRLIYSSDANFPIGTTLSDQISADIRAPVLQIGQTSYTTSHAQSAYGFELLILHDYSSLTSSIFQAIVPLLVTAVLCMVVFLMLSLQISRHMVQPIRQLQSSLKAMEQGDLSHKIDLVSEDEIGELARSFNIMLERLNHYIETSYREKLKSLDAEFRALQAQINPHFLYNALESVNSLALISGNEQISAMVCSLADMFRYITEQKKPVVTVRQELLYVCNYLTLQNISHTDQVSIEIEIEEPVYAHQIPKMCLQPLIENCFVHAWQNDRHAMRIRISGVCSEDGCQITVTDNGSGIPPASLERLRESLAHPSDDADGTSIGLHNISDRLHLLFAERGALTISANPAGGTSVSIHLP